MIKYQEPSSEALTVNEALSSYGPKATKYDKLVLIMGGSSMITAHIKNDFDLITLSRTGLPKSTLAFLSKVLNISKERMSELLHVSHRTIQRKKDDDLISVHSTEQVIEIAEVIAKGMDVFEDLDILQEWLHSPLSSLNRQQPIELLDTSFGTNILLTELGRLEHGVF